MRLGFVSPEGSIDGPQLHNVADAPTEELAGTLAGAAIDALADTHHGWPRRIATAGAYALGTAVVLDVAATNAVYWRPGMPVGINPINPDSPGVEDRKATILAGGYTQRSGREIASPRIVDETISPHRALMSLDLKPRIHRIRDTADAFQRQFARNERPFDLVTASMGTPFVVAGLAHLIRQGEKVPKVERHDVISSPYSIGSIQDRQADYFRGIDKSRRFGMGYYPGGIAVKAAIRVRNSVGIRQVVDRKTEEVYDDVGFWRAALDGLYLGCVGATPQLCANQPSLVLQSQLHADIATLAEAGVIGDHTEVNYWRSVDPGHDKIVKVELAGAEYQGDLEPIVGKFAIRRYGRRHVDPLTLYPIAEDLAQTV